MNGPKEKTCQFDVLIVDPSGETNEIISTVLRRHGIQTEAAATGAEGLETLRRERPRVTVVDLDGQRDEDSFNRDFVALSSQLGKGLVLLGTEKSSQAGNDQVRFVEKPYRYGPLIRTIEALVGSTVPEANESPSRRAA